MKQLKIKKYVSDRSVIEDDTPIPEMNRKATREFLKMCKNGSLIELLEKMTILMV